MNEEYRKIWRKPLGVPLTPREFADRQTAFRRWVANRHERRLSSPVNFVRKHYREERQRQLVEECANDGWEDYYDDDELLHLAAEQEMMTRFLRDAEIQNLISSALPPDPALCVGRNQPCPCGSGRKFKKCCG